MDIRSFCSSCVDNYQPIEIWDCHNNVIFKGCTNIYSDTADISYEDMDTIFSNKENSLTFEDFLDEEINSWHIEDDTVIILTDW